MPRHVPKAKALSPLSLVVYSVQIRIAGLGAVSCRRFRNSRRGLSSSWHRRLSRLIVAVAVCILLLIAQQALSFSPLAYSALLSVVVGFLTRDMTIHQRLPSGFNRHAHSRRSASQPARHAYTHCRCLGQIQRDKGADDAADASQRRRGANSQGALRRWIGLGCENP